MDSGFVIEHCLNYSFDVYRACAIVYQRVTGAVYPINAVSGS